MSALSTLKISVVALGALLLTAGGGAYAQTVSPTYNPGTNTGNVVVPRAAAGSHNQSPHSTVPPPPKAALVRYPTRTTTLRSTPQPLHGSSSANLPAHSRKAVGRQRVPVPVPTPGIPK